MGSWYHHMCACASLCPYKLFNLTTFHEIWYEHHATRGHLPFAEFPNINNTNIVDVYTSKVGTTIATHNVAS
jgi:hypothetical protein